MRIFISAVTSEFGKARDALASDLRARGHEVAVQSDFTQGPDSETLLGRLADYIHDCNAVVCVVGKHCGACPPPRAAKHFEDALPDGIKEASYTQWEFFLARHFKRRPYLYIAGDGYKPDRDPAATDRTALQSVYREYLKAHSVHYAGFSDVNELRIAVLRDEPNIAAGPASRRTAPKPIVLPYPSIGDRFKGRDDFMRRLHDSLTRARGGRTAIVSQALYGHGGIGKTRAAVEYAWAHADDYNALLFVVAETPEVLRRNLAALAATLLPQLDITDGAARVAAVLDWLNANPGWLLILDNVDTEEAFSEVERQLSGLIGGHVVVTSRLADFSANFEPLELNVLAVDDAAAFLLEQTKDRRRTAHDDEAQAREVARELNGLVLALEQAAALIAQRRLSFAQYLEQWRSKREDDDSAPDQVIAQRPAAFRFGVRNGKIDTLPERAEFADLEAAKDLYDELKAKARALGERLTQTNSDQRAQGSISRLLDALGARLADVKPGILLSRSRSIEADRNAFHAPKARRELFPDAIAMMDDVLLSARDLMAVFPIIREIEAEQMALAIQRDPVSLRTIRRDTETITHSAAASEVVAATAVAALKEQEPDIEAARNIVVRARLVADQLLVVRNFVSEAFSATRAGGKAIAAKAEPGLRRAGSELADLGGKSWEQIKDNLPEGVGAAARLLPVAALAALLASIVGPVGGLAAFSGGFKEIAKAIKKFAGGGKGAKKSKKAKPKVKRRPKQQS